MVCDDMKNERLAERAFLKLLEIKDSDIRLLAVLQGKTAVDKGIHIGGAFSAVVPLVSLYYGGILDFNAAQPTQEGQDLFVLSKGHAIAALASVYADLGFFPESCLRGSRGHGSILNGHPGPILPGIHTATGPLGQGICVAEGFALAAQCAKGFDVFALTGDGELQEGIPWEAFMFAGARRLENLCVLVDKNNGQLDNPKNLLYPMGGLDALEHFGWNVFTVDATRYEPVLEALREFKFGPRDGHPTLIICDGRKGWGGLSSFMGGHKVDFTDAFADQEAAEQERLRAVRVAELADIIASVEGKEERDALRAEVEARARKMGLVVSAAGGAFSVQSGARAVKTRRAPARDKRIAYDAAALPVLDDGKKYSAQEVITAAMKVFARDPRVVSVDADLAGISGLEAGVGYVDRRRALNAGIAEANMMCIGESFAALGYNAWVSTFAPFFDWKVLRRIAVSQQERLEAAEMKDGWLAEGHGLDLTFLATSPDIETKTNGATHMGNDDSLVYEGIAHLKVVNASCPRQTLAILKWIMEGGRGLVYLRVLRGATPVLYPGDFRFDFGKGYYLANPPGAKVCIVSSGHGVYEALGAAKILEGKGVPAAVVDMPSCDPALIGELADSGKKIVVAEQNNGYIWNCFRKVLFGKKAIAADGFVPINLLGKDGNPRFVHSATYEELLQHYGLSPDLIAERIAKEVK
ncbi:MAG: transketolase [Spirochaetia bacterium]|jgi:transketolase|nr:transketolase [Spirochaetia bacterium]